MSVSKIKLEKDEKTEKKEAKIHPLPNYEQVDDVFTDEMSLMQAKLDVDYGQYVSRLEEANPDMFSILKQAESLEQARDEIFNYLEQAERKVLSVENTMHVLENATVRDAIRACKSVMAPINESRTKVSALETLWRIAQQKEDELKHQPAPGFIMEFIHLFRALLGKSYIYLENTQAERGVPDFLKLEGRKAATARMEILDDLGGNVRKYFKKYPSGLEEEIADWRKRNAKRVMKYFNATEKEWNDYQWQLKNIIVTPEPLADLIELTTDQREAVEKAVKHKIPFGITPYYLSLMDSKLSLGYDHAIRAQVIPPKDYVDQMVANKESRDMKFDFMGEHDTSPVDLITRRYPWIAILKPFNTCAQICVYCQRNWEIDGCMAPDAMASDEYIENALSWLDEHPSVGDILITGGDPMVMNDKQIKKLVKAVASRPQVYRIRFGTRTPVVMPQRWTESIMGILREYHNPPHREIAVITHFEHSYEITPEALDAVQKIRKSGMMVYNQEVFTVHNSRKFESVKLRRDLKSIGIDPYYNFNMKGKLETRKYMVPISRILQERKEEARLLPGLDRTDEPVFNVPRLGKNHLRAGQDHRLVMIMPDGSRVYEFHPWEKNISAVPPYNYRDVPIFDYLEELAKRGENLYDYRTIWFYY